MKPEALEAWKYDDAMNRKALLTAWDAHQREIQRKVEIDEAREPYSVGSKLYDSRKHPMTLSETVKRNLAACMTVSFYLP